MKYKFIIISLMGIMLFGVEGCSSDGPSIAVSSPYVVLIYTDMDGNSSFQELNNADKYVLDKNIFEIISVQDSEGNPVKIRNVSSGVKQPRPGMGFQIAESYSYRSPDTIREYTIKYKVRAIFGEDHIETLYLKYEVVSFGTFTDCRYNNESVRIVDPYSVVPEHENADDVDWDKVHQDRDALLFSGKTTASLCGDEALIIIPVEKVVEN